MSIDSGSRASVRGGMHYGYVVAGLGLLALLGAQGLGRFGYPLVLPGMRDGLSLSYTQTGLLAGVNSAGYLLFSIIAGAFAARHGPRPVISTALGLTSLAMFLLAVAPTFLIALGAQFLLGVAMAFVSVPAMAMCTAWFAPSRRGMATGIVAAGSGVGLVVTGVAVPVILRIHADNADWWRFAWSYFGLAVFVFTLLAALLLRNRPRPGQPRVGEVEPGPLVAVPNKPSLFGSEVWRVPGIWYLAFLSGINTFAYVGFATFFAAYLINERDIDPGTTGALWSLAGIIALFSGMLWGMLSDRAGRKVAVGLIFTTQIACFGLFALSPSLAGYVVAAVLYGLIARANFAVSAAACGDLVGPSLAPAAFGINALGAGLGLTIGPVIGGPVADMTGSFQAVFLISATAAALGLVATSRLHLPKTSL